MLEARTQFRRIIGHTDLAKLALAVEHDVAATRAANDSAARVHTLTTTAAPEVAATPA